MAEDINERVTRVEMKVDEHSRLLNAQMEKNETLTRMATLMERQVEDSKEFKIQLEKFSNTMDNVNENLTNLNNRQEQLNNSQQQLGQRVDNIENTLEGQKIDPNNVFKSILSHALTGVFSIIVAIILWKFGVSNN